MYKHLRVLIVITFANLNFGAWATDFCDFKEATKCTADGKCSLTTASPISYLGLDNSKKLRLCFSDAKCVSAVTTIRNSPGHGYIATAIFQNPKEYGGMPKKLFGSFVWADFAEIQGRGAIYPVYQGGEQPDMFLSSTDCQSPSKKKKK